MRRIKDGFRLLRQSWEVVRRDPQLILVMGVGFLLQVLVAGTLFLLVFRRTPEAADFRFPKLLWIYPILIVSGVFGAMASATVIATAMRRLEGREASVREGFECVKERFPQLVGWTVFGSIVGLFIQLIAEKLKLGGRIAAFLMGVSWIVVSMLVVPVLLFEKKGVLDSLKRSGSLIKEKWGEGVTGYGSINIALIILIMPLMIGASLLVVVDVALAVLAMVVLTLGLMLVAGTLGGVFSAALYRYASTGEASGPFSSAQLSSTFVTKQEKKRPLRRALRYVTFAFLGIYLVIKALQLAGVIPDTGR